MLQGSGWRAEYGACWQQLGSGLVRRNRVTMCNASRLFQFCVDAAHDLE